MRFIRRCTRSMRTGKNFPDVIDENRRTYNGMLLAMDRSIGRVLDRLDKHGIVDNTIVVFMNDNGGGGSTDLYAAHSRNYANNKPLSGHKFDVLEGGVRVPLILRWPNTSRPARSIEKWCRAPTFIPRWWPPPVYRCRRDSRSTAWTCFPSSTTGINPNRTIGSAGRTEVGSQERRVVLSCLLPKSTTAPSAKGTGNSCG